MPVTGFFGSTYYGPPATAAPEEPSGPFDPGAYFAESYFVDEYFAGDYWPNVSGFEPSPLGPDPSRTIVVVMPGVIDPSRTLVREF